MYDSVISINERTGLLKLNGSICQNVAMDFRERLELLICYYQHQNLTLHINSDGGEATALRHMLDSIRLHRQKGITFATQASFKACSAGAVLLASGEPGMRSVSRQSSLLFHHSRHVLEGNRVITAEDAMRLAGMLTQVDANFEQALVAHLSEGFGDVVSLAEEGETRCRLLLSRADVLVQQQVALSCESLAIVANSVRAMWTACSLNRSVEPYMTYLRTRFARDVWMELVEAYVLVLIDTVDQVSALVPRAAPQPLRHAQQRMAA